MCHQVLQDLAWIIRDFFSQLYKFKKAAVEQPNNTVSSAAELRYEVSEPTIAKQPNAPTSSTTEFNYDIPFCSQIRSIKKDSQSIQMWYSNLTEPNRHNMKVSIAWSKSESCRGMGAPEECLVVEQGEVVLGGRDVEASEERPTGGSNLGPKSSQRWSQLWGQQWWGPGGVGVRSQDF